MVPITRSMYARCPRRSWRSQQFLNSQLFHLLDEFATEDAVAVAQQIARRAVPRKRLPQLLRFPENDS